ncbi:alpha/beta hydrolase [Austwickia chelonae]|uniref:alpha/beta hydrolase n=1 Tax=Austwickia chelonae TaxID=100225 RepID=UPI000E240158|nr:alpha/beta hydrolase [Austwickia chelonae]
MPRHRRLHIVTALALVAGTTSPASATEAPQQPAAPPPTTTPAAPAGLPPLNWQKCTGDLDGHECSELQVPLDHSKPDGEKITIALSRAAHTGPERRGVILVNPGGPGLDGRSRVGMARNVSKDIAESYDFVGFAPRGVSGSRPELKCEPKAPRPHRTIPRNQADIDAWLAYSQSTAESCATGDGAKLLPFTRTTDIADDMDWIRSALGVDKVTYFGVSWGTYLGQTFATRHQNRIERMVWDGAIDPNGQWAANILGQNASFQKAADAFFSWIATRDDEFTLGKTHGEVKAKYEAGLKKLEDNPIDTPRGKVTSNQLSSTALSATYGVHDWKPKAKALSDFLVHGKTDELGVSHPPDNGTAAYWATECSESPRPTPHSWVASAKKSHEAGNTFESWGNAWTHAPCTFWKVKRDSTPKIDGSQVKVPILIVHDSEDAATPYPGAMKARSAFPSSRLVVQQDGRNHGTAYIGNQCTQQAVDDFFRDGKLPARADGDKADKTCGAFTVDDHLKQHEDGQGRR